MTATYDWIEIMARRQLDTGALLVLREKFDRRRQSQEYLRQKEGSTRDCDSPLDDDSGRPATQAGGLAGLTV